MAWSRIKTAFTGLDGTPFNGYMLAELTTVPITLPGGEIVNDNAFRFYVKNGQAYKDAGATQLAELPATISSSPANVPISIKTLPLNSNRLTHYVTAIIPVEALVAGVPQPVNLADLAPIEPDQPVTYNAVRTFGGMSGDIDFTGQGVEIDEEAGVIHVRSIIHLGAWDALTHWLRDDVVEHEGSSWSASADNVGIEPGTAPTTWQLVAHQGEQGIQGLRGMNHAGLWNIMTDYAKDDAVSYGGGYWVALQPSTGMAPTFGAYWSLVSDRGPRGYSPNTTTTASYTVSNTQATLAVVNSEPLVAGSMLTLIHGADRLTVILDVKPTDTSITFTPVSLRPSGEVANGTIFPSGSSVSVSGPPGIQGNTGPEGAPGWRLPTKTKMGTYDGSTRSFVLPNGGPDEQVEVGFLPIYNGPHYTRSGNVITLAADLALQNGDEIWGTASLADWNGDPGDVETVGGAVPATTATPGSLAKRDGAGNLEATKFVGDGSLLTNLETALGITMAKLKAMPIVVGHTGKPTASQEIFIMVVRTPFNIPAGVSSPAGLVRVFPTAVAVSYLIKKNGTQIGYIEVTSGGVVSVNITTASSFGNGDILTVEAPNPVDATLSTMSATILASLV